MRSFTTPLALAAYLAATTAIADSGTLTVSGQGQVVVIPDMATINLGVLNAADTANDAVAGMSEKVSDILAALIEAGLPASDVQTSSLRVNPIQNYNNATGNTRITGYTAQTTIAIRVMELDALGMILDQALSDGANQLNGLQFDVADRRPHLDEARRLAVADAIAKAVVYASAADVSIGSLMAMAEGGVSRGPVVMEMSMARDAGVPVAAGDISISASVTMTYAID